MSSISKRSSRSRSPSTRSRDSPKSNKQKLPHDSKSSGHHSSKKHRTSHKDDSEEKSTSGRSSSKKLSKHPKSPPDKLLKRKRSSSKSSSCSSDVGNFKRSKKSSNKSSHHDSSEQKKKHKKHKKEKKKKKKKKHKKSDKSSDDEKMLTGKDTKSSLNTTEKVTSLQLPSKVKESMSNEDCLSASGPSPRVLKPMTKEEWEKQQSVIRRVYDPTTGRNRLVKGDGEILEEIVSKEKHQQINKQATIGDGLYYQSKMGLHK